MPPTPTAIRVRTTSGWQDIALKGADGVLRVYEQPNDPGAVPAGSVWIDTDDAPGVAYILQVGQVYLITGGYTADRAFNPEATTLTEVARVLGSLIDDMKAAGLIRP